MLGLAPLRVLAYLPSLCRLHPDQDEGEQVLCAQLL